MSKSFLGKRTFKKTNQLLNGNYQSGYIALMMLLILILGAGTLFGVINEDSIAEKKQHLTAKELIEIEEIKRRLIHYSVFFPEIMSTDETTPNDMTDIAMLPSPGYLPCPDINRDVDGKSDNVCGNPLTAGDSTSGFVIGFLPTAVTLRHQYFSGFQPQSPQKFYYVLDEHLAYKNSNYGDFATGGPGRYAPLLLTRDATSGNLVFADGEQPVLELNNDGIRYVALIIIPGSPLSGQDRSSLSGDADSTSIISEYLEGENADLDNVFYSSGKVTGANTNDIIIGITAEEWMNNITQRVCMQYSGFVTANPTGLDSTGTALQPFWFNAFDAVDNMTGTGYRELIGNGTIGCGQ